jgi:teichuronic acid biosynthesis glycosyltransferase TuaG
MKNERDELVSIIVPVYNAEKFIASMVTSVIEQTYTDWELILVDDKSDDRSLAIIDILRKRDDRIKLITMAVNSGAGASRNIGTGAARGRYIAFLDADDIWAPTKLDVQLSFMRKYKHAFTYTGYEFADAEGISTKKRVHVPHKISYPQALKNHIIWTSTVMIDLHQVDKKVVLMPDIRRGQDAATWWKVLRTVGYAYGIDSPLSYYRRTSASLSANKLVAIKRTWYLFTKVEKLGYVKSSYNFVYYSFNAVRKRI